MEHEYGYRQGTQTALEGGKTDCPECSNVPKEREVIGAERKELYGAPIAESITCFSAAGFSVQLHPSFLAFICLLVNLHR